MITALTSFALFSCDKEDMRPDDKSIFNGNATEQLRRLPESKSDATEKLHVKLPVTEEMTAAVIAVVKPIREVVEKLLNEDKTGMYEAYKKDAETLSAMKDPFEKRKFVEAIHEKYFDFFSEVWKKADVDEGAYQEKIKNIFPREIGETIKFKEFLTFSMHVKKPTRDHNPVPPAPPAPAPENICMNPATLWFGIRHEDHGGISVARADVDHENVHAFSLASVAGYGNATAGLASDITIPGTFPDDDRLLRVKKTFTWKAEITAFSFIGCSFASVYVTTVANEEYLRLWAPVTWIAFDNFDEQKMEEYLIQKKFLYNIRYGVSVNADSFAEILASSTSSSTCLDVKWSICEEYPN